MRRNRSLHQKLDFTAQIIYRPLGENGEDAFSYDVRGERLHAQAVFDGCGGAGAWRYREFNNHTGAFVAAQSMALTWDNWFQQAAGLSARSEALTGSGLYACSEGAERLADSFGRQALTVLQGLKEGCEPMDISGSLVKSFPCTASAAVVGNGPGDTITLTTLHVGDSRVYYLRPEQGLVQLTADDSRGCPDPMESLRDSAPLSDMLNADKPFRIKTRQITLELPCMVICATDGVFGYLRSPMDFEYLLLDCLMRAESVYGFEQEFRRRIMEATGDDSTCLLSSYGCGGPGEWQRRLKKRYDAIRRMVRKMDSVSRTEELEQVMRQLWESYKKETVYDEMQR